VEVYNDLDMPCNEVLPLKDLLPEQPGRPIGEPLRKKTAHGYNVFRIHFPVRKETP
jgi:hypothetical protein